MRGRLTCLLIGIMLVLLVGGSSITERNVEFLQSLAADSQDEPVAVVSETADEFEYYRERLLEMTNMTLDDYEKMLPSDKERADIYVQALWGYENGTLTEEEAQAMIQPNSPQTYFAPGYILGYLDFLNWFDALHKYPSIFSIPRSDDERFEIHFASRAPYLERIIGVKAELMNDSQGLNSQDLILAEILQRVDTGHIQYPDGTIWRGHYWWDFFGNRHLGMDYVWPLFSDCSIFSASVKPLYFDDAVAVRISYLHEYFNPWINWPMGQWSDTEESSFLFNHYSNGAPIAITDDDETAPEGVSINVENSAAEFSWETPYIYDTANSLIIVGNFTEGQELSEITFEKNSGISMIDMEIDGQTIPYSWSVKEKGLYYSFPASLKSLYQFRIEVANPFSYLGVGTHTIEVSATDGDNDRENDTSTSEPLTLNFEIREEETDTSPPTTIPDIIGTLGDGGWYTSDVTLSLSTIEDTSNVDQTSSSSDQRQGYFSDEQMQAFSDGDQTQTYFS